MKLAKFVITIVIVIITSIFLPGCNRNEAETDPVIKEKFQSHIWNLVKTDGLGNSNQEAENLSVKYGDLYSQFKEMPTYMYFSPDGGTAALYINGTTILSGGKMDYKIFKEEKFQFEGKSMFGYKLTDDGFLYFFDLKENHFTIKYRAIKKIESGSNSDYFKELGLE